MIKEFTTTTGKPVAINVLHVCSITQTQYGKQYPKQTEIALTNGERVFLSDDYDYVVETLGAV